MLGDARFAINAWSTDHVDSVYALDVQEYDATIFGVLEVSMLIMSNLFFVHML